MIRKVRVGIVGCGGLPQGVLLPCLALIPELELVATCDLVEEKAKALAQQYGAPIWTMDWVELVEMDGLDAIMVAAPPAVHEEVGVAALRKGLHLFLEKPPSMTAEGARHLVKAAEGTGLKTLLGTVQRHTPACRMMKEISQRPEFGAPLLYQARYCCPGPGMRMDWGMDRNSEAEMMRFFLLDHIIHHIDLARFFMGEIAKVSAIRSEGLQDRYNFAASLRFANGVAGNMSCCFRAPSFDNHAVLYGDGPAAVEVRNWTRLEYRPRKAPVGKGGYDDSPKVIWDGGIGFEGGAIRPGYREELALWARAILEGVECHATVEDGWRDMLALEAMMESLTCGTKSEVPIQ